MRFAAGPPSRWTVELLDGSIVDVWADGYARDGDDFTFSSLIDLDDDEELPSDALVVGETPSDPRRFILASAIFPKAAVRLRDGDVERPAIYSR